MQTLCAACGIRRRRSSHKYCADCFAAYMRDWRQDHPLSAAARARDNVRSYAGTYKRRGKIEPQSCMVCGRKAQMHHPDYARPLLVEWLCSKHHRMLHGAGVT
jgi:hypothetical protein